MPERGMMLLRDLYQAEMIESAKEHTKKDPSASTFMVYPKPGYAVLGYNPDHSRVYRVKV